MWRGTGGQDGSQDSGWVGTVMSALAASLALCAKWEDVTETFALRTCRSQWMRNGSKIQLMCIFHFLLILMVLCLLSANLPGSYFRWMQEGRLNCCKEPNISAVHGAGDVRGVWCWQGILRMTLWRPLCLPLGAFLCPFSS